MAKNKKPLTAQRYRSPVTMTWNKSDAEKIVLAYGFEEAVLRIAGKTFRKDYVRHRLKMALIAEVITENGIV